MGRRIHVIATRRMSFLLFVAWIVIGIIVASNRHYFAHLQTASDVGSAILAVLVWPLVLLHIHIGT